MIEEIEVVLNGEPITEIDFIPRAGECISVMLEKSMGIQRYIVRHVEYAVYPKGGDGVMVCSASVNVEEIE